MVKFYKGGFVVLLVSSFLLLYGCAENGKEEESVQASANENSELVNEGDEVAESVDHVQPEAPNEGVEQEGAVISEEEPVRQFTSLDEVKSLIQMDMTEEEVKASLGDDFVTFNDSFEGLPVWRYDINAIEGYFFDDYEGGVDIEGIADGKLEYQVFITWYNGKIDYISIFYKANDHLIEGYYEFEDGYTKIDEIPI